MSTQINTNLEQSGLECRLTSNCFEMKTHHLVQLNVVDDGRRNRCIRTSQTESEDRFTKIALKKFIIKQSPLLNELKTQMSTATLLRTLFYFQDTPVTMSR